MPSSGTALTRTPERSPGNRGTTQELDGGAESWSLDGLREELVVSVSGPGGVLPETTVRLTGCGSAAPRSAAGR
ncbi:MAG: hypothetical protein M3P89_05500 [Actinomycetota bacterium]|nr:hypothetical protein [Actinomycetota bacterium]